MNYANNMNNGNYPSNDWMWMSDGGFRYPAPNVPGQWGQSINDVARSANTFNTQNSGQETAWSYQQANQWIPPPPPPNNR